MLTAINNYIVEVDKVYVPSRMKYAVFIFIIAITIMNSFGVFSIIPKAKEWNWSKRTIIALISIVVVVVVTVSIGTFKRLSRIENAGAKITNPQTNKSIMLTNKEYERFKEVKEYNVIPKDDVELKTKLDKIK